MPSKGNKTIKPGQAGLFELDTHMAESKVNAYFLLTLTQFPSARVIHSKQSHDAIDDLSHISTRKRCRNWWAYKQLKILVFGKAKRALVDKFHLHENKITSFQKAGWCCTWCSLLNARAEVLNKWNNGGKIDYSCHIRYFPRPYSRQLRSDLLLIVYDPDERFLHETGYKKTLDKWAQAAVKVPSVSIYATLVTVVNEEIINKREPICLSRRAA